ncbi:hypothetical protein H4582DRAFT_2129227 [Lactarius indigo]|nr:hypothetical protein H4582DRAFT_2129227 [Lactarius indigo]
MFHCSQSPIFHPRVGHHHCIHEYRTLAPHSLLIPVQAPHMINKVTVMAALGNSVPEILHKSVRTAALQLRGSEAAWWAQETTPIRPGLRIRFSSRRTTTRQENTHFSKREDTQGLTPASMAHRPPKLALSLLPSIPYSFGTPRNAEVQLHLLRDGYCSCYFPMEEDAAGAEGRLGLERTPPSGATADNDSSTSNNAAPNNYIIWGAFDSDGLSDLPCFRHGCGHPRKRRSVSLDCGDLLSLRSPNDGDDSGIKACAGAYERAKIGYLGCEHRPGVTLVSGGGELSRATILRQDDFTFEKNRDGEELYTVFGSGLLPSNQGPMRRKCNIKATVQWSALLRSLNGKVTAKKDRKGGE